MTTTAQRFPAQRKAHHRPKVDLFSLARAAIQKFLRDDCTGLAAEAAYHLFFSVFPLAIFAASLSALINRVFHLDLFDKIMTALTSVLPADARSAIADALQHVLQSQSGGLLSFGILAALWSGSNAIGTFIKALNRVYEVEETRPFWQTKVLQLALTIFVGFLTIAAFVLVVFGGKIGNRFATAMGYGHAFDVVWNLLRWPIVIICIMFALAVLYQVGPNVKQEFRWLSLGAVLATIVWLLAMSAFGVYVSRFGSYNATYGTLGGVIVLMLVFYISSLIILLGAELNSELGRRYDSVMIADIAAHPEKERGDGIEANGKPQPPLHRSEIVQ